MTFRSVFLLLIIASVSASPVAAATIASTASGGAWENGATWVGGIPPVSGDDVVISGPVLVSYSRTCNNLSIELSGSLKNGVGAPYLIVNGNVHNEGTIANGALYSMYLRVFGDLYNAGVWTNLRTYLAGSGSHDISQEFGSDFDTWISYSDGAGDLIALNEVSISSLDLTGGQFILQPNAHFTLMGGFFRGNLFAGGNEVRSNPTATFSDCTIDDAVMTGELLVGHNATFTTRLTVMGTLLNSSGGGSVTVDGALINYGLIDWQHSSFQNFEVTGDLENYGTISIPVLAFSGTDAVHHLKMSADAVIESQVFLSQFDSPTLVADTPLQFSGALTLGGGTLVLGAESSLGLTDSGIIQSGLVTGNGHPVRITGNGYLADITVDQGVIVDSVGISGTCLFTNGLTVQGTIFGPTWGTAEISVEGLLANEGSIDGGANSLNVFAFGDIRNSGLMINCILTMAGDMDQFVGAGSEMAVDQFVINSGLQGPGYQWFRNGSAMLGETGQNLSFSDVGPGTFAQYHCETEEEISRMVSIDESLTATAVSGPTRRVTLQQNSPNPFNPITEISFSLDREDEVSLIIYDIAGREVQRLLDSTMGAGQHSVIWQPRTVASGTYFYALKAGNTVLFKKCVLLK